MYLLHCLNEINVEFPEVLNSGYLRDMDMAKLSPNQGSTLVFLLLTSGEELTVFQEPEALGQLLWSSAFFGNCIVPLVCPQV